MGIKEQLEMLHHDGYHDSEETLRSYVSGKAEFDYLKKFAEQSGFDADVCRDQFRALWTAYCLHNRQDCDTRAYDNDLLELWHTVEASEPETADWSDFDSFDGYMCRHLC